MKFPDKQTEILYELAIDGMADDSTGDSSNWVMHADLFDLHENPGCLRPGFYILWEHSSGETASERFDSESEARQVFSAIKILYLAWIGE